MEHLVTNFLLLITCSLSLIYMSVSLSSPSCNKGLELQLPYMTSNVKDIEGKYFDYIIVGGGACGCPLAATLSEKYSVLVIERGDSPYGNPTIIERKKFGFPLVEANEFTSVAQKFVSIDGVENYRGRVLGGSTAINSGFYSRASSEFIRKMGWDEKMVEEAYEWIESKVVFPPMLSPWQSTVLDGLLEAGVLPFNGYTLEHVEGSKMSGTIFDLFGKRHTAADLLGGGKVKNIVVLLNATVSKIIFEKNGDQSRARGVKFIKSEGNTKQAYNVYLKKPKKNNSSSSFGEVILSAGALSSPQILMLSGIGPTKQLNKFDIIPQVMNLRGVGKRMQDNPAISLLVDSKPQWRTPDTPQVAGIINNYKIIIESIIVPITKNITRVSIAGKLAFPSSRGTLELDNKDPRQNPKVRFNYLAKEEDMNACVKVHQMVGEVSMSNAVAFYLGNERANFVKSGIDEIKRYCKENVKTFYHYHGGCTVGSVVDKEYKVYGVKGLRVIDGSTLVESPGTNPMATLMMLARYQGLKIIEKRLGSS